MASHRGPELSRPRRRAAQIIIVIAIVLNLALAALFGSVSGSFTLQEQVVRGQGIVLCQNALAERLDWQGDPMVGSLRYVDTAVAEGRYSYRSADDAARISGTIRCTFDAPRGRDSLRVVEMELLP